MQPAILGRGGEGGRELNIKYPNFDDPFDKSPQLLNVAIMSLNKDKTTYAAISFMKAAFELKDVQEILKNDKITNIENTHTISIKVG